MCGAIGRRIAFAIKPPLSAKKTGPEPQEKQPGQPPPSKLTAHYTPVSPICNSACCAGLK